MMRQEEIDILLDKYERGICSAEETVIVEAFLAEADSEYIPGYSEFIDDQQAIASPASVMHFVEEDNIDALLLEQEANIDGEYIDFITEERNIRCAIDVYQLIALHEDIDGQLAAQESSVYVIYGEFIADERSITYSGSVEDIIAKHEADVDTLLQIQEAEIGGLYSEFITQERSVTCSLDVNTVIANHEANIDVLLEEQEANLDTDYKAFITEERAIRTTLSVDDIITKQTEAKVIPMGGKWRKLVGVAAVFIAIMGTIFLMRLNTEIDQPYADVMTEQERMEAEEALEFTLAALGVTKNKMDKGTQNLKLLRELEHTNIYK